MKEYGKKIKKILINKLILNEVSRLQFKGK